MCMCGDVCCPSCGPAQGNSQCLLCGSWAGDCEHFDEDGEVLPQYQKAMQEAETKEWEVVEELARALNQEAQTGEESPL